MPKTIPKYGVQEVINFVGMRHLDTDEQDVVQELTTENYGKIKRELKKFTSMTVHIKPYGDLHKGKGAKEKREELPKRRKYSIHVRVDAPMHIFESCKAHDWDLARALHKSFEDIKKQIQHRLHNDVTRPKTYG